MTPEERDELYARASFGKQIESFWGSRIGAYLQDRAKESYTAAVQQLKTCDPTDAKLVARLQGEVWRAESFDQWLSQAVIDGLKSMDLLNGEEDEIPEE